MKKNIDGMIPPQAIEIEEILLAGLMTENDAFYKIQNLISEDVFYLQSHRYIFRSIQSLALKGLPCDVAMVTQNAKDNNILDEIGGVYFLTVLSSKAALSYHVEYHARILMQKYIQRELIRIGRETAAVGFDDTVDIEDQLNDLKNKIVDIENIAVSTNSGKQQQDTLISAIQEMEADCTNYKLGKPAGITTGLKYLNGSTGGWRPTNLIIIASRPGVGKTSLALHFTKIAAQTGSWVNFYGLEMTSEDLMRIMISAESYVDRIDIRDGRLTEPDWDKINDCTANIEKLPLLWYDNAGITSGQIAANTRKNVKKGKCDMVVVDYLQLISATDKKAIREQQISEITRTLKKTALEMKVPIILLSQLNREASEGKPQLHHLRESGAIEQDADVVILPWRDTQDRYQLIVAKNRRGQTGMFEISVNEEMTRFDNLGKMITKKNNSEESPF